MSLTVDLLCGDLGLEAHSETAGERLPALQLQEDRLCLWCSRNLLAPELEPAVASSGGALSAVLQGPAAGSSFWRTLVMAVWNDLVGFPLCSSGDAATRFISQSRWLRHRNLLADENRGKF